MAHALQEELHPETWRVFEFPFVIGLWLKAQMQEDILHFISIK